MKKFVFKLSLLIFVICLLLGAQLFYVFKFLMPQRLEEYSASLIDKVARISTIQEPKIVLIGNSHFVFDVDSQKIEETFLMPVVNMGFHGGMDNAFHERMAKINVHKGDIYILSHSNYSDDGQIDEADLAWATLENHKELWKLISIIDVPKLSTGFYDYSFRAIQLKKYNLGNRTDNSSWYHRDWFNEYGDNIYPREKNLFDFSTHPISVPSINYICINRINRLNDYLSKRGATLIVAGYPIAYGEYTADKADFQQFQIELEEALDCEVISDCADYMFDYSLFFDTFLHLNDHGKELYTSQLIEDLKKWFKR